MLNMSYSYNRESYSCSLFHRRTDIDMRIKSRKAVVYSPYRVNVYVFQGTDVGSRILQVQVQPLNLLFFGFFGGKANKGLNENMSVCGHYGYRDAVLSLSL